MIIVFLIPVSIYMLYLLGMFQKHYKLPTKTNTEKNLSYNENVKLIDQKWVDKNLAFYLYDINEFNEIISYSDKYLNDAINIIEDSTTDKNSRIVVIYTMQNLNTKNYKTFLDKLAELYIHNKISEEEMTAFLLPGPDWNNQVSNSFLKFSYRKTLNKIKIKKGNSKYMISLINNILNGKVWLNQFK